MCIRDSVIEARESKQPQKGQMITPDGRHWFVRGYPVLDEEGSVKALIEYGQDITDSVRAEERIKEEKERAEFYLDLLCHDLNNIHQGISGALQLATMNTDDSDRRSKCMKVAQSAVWDSLNLTKEVMLLSKIMKEEPVLSRTDLLTILDLSLDQIHRMFPEKKIMVDKNITENSVLAEPFLKEVFINIIHNGVRLQGKEPYMEIDTFVEDGWVVTRICDKGPGIPDHMKKDLFRKYGMKGGRTRTGLGLSIVNSLVKRYHGKITVEDRIEGDSTGGACFKIYLPRI
jgi:signal transduction histidine kinase